MTKEEIIEDLDTIVDDVYNGHDDFETIAKNIRNVRYNINEWLTDTELTQGEK